MHSISIIFVATCLIFYLGLSINAAMMRRKSGIAIGENNNEKLARAVRAHANFAEYTPLFLIAFIVLESTGVSSQFLTWTGLAFLLGRIFHAYSMFAHKGLFRVLGMMLTFIPCLAMIVLLLVVYFK
jgi:uncharacterized membrane protein YecN with MAPEG domain